MLWSVIDNLFPSTYFLNIAVAGISLKCTDSGDDFDFVYSSVSG